MTDTTISPSLENTAVAVPLDILSKSTIEVRATDVVDRLLEDYDAVTAYVIAKQYAEASTVMVKMLKPKAEVAYNFGKAGVRIGAAKVDFVNAKPDVVWTFAPDIQAELDIIAQTVAAEEARAEVIRKSAIEAGKATKEEVPSNRGGIKITLDK